LTVESDLFDRRVSTVELRCHREELVGVNAWRVHRFGRTRNFFSCLSRSRYPTGRSIAN